MEKLRMVFSGSGGQGVITAAIIIAEAAVLYEGLNAVQSQSYGAEARGGATRSDVIISDSIIDYPKVIQPNLLVCLTQDAYNKFYDIIRPGGLLITDSRYVKIHKKVDAQQREIPIYDRVMDTIGKPIVFNIAMLGTLISITELMGPESIMKVLEKRIPPDFLDMNREALDLGLQISSESEQAANAAIQEHTNRRIWLALSLVPIFVVVGVLLLYIRTLPTPTGLSSSSGQ